MKFCAEFLVLLVFLFIGFDPDLDFVKDFWEENLFIGLLENYCEYGEIIINYFLSFIRFKKKNYIYFFFLFSLHQSINPFLQLLLNII